MSLISSKITKAKLERDSLRFIGRTKNNVFVTDSEEGIEYWDLEKLATSSIESSLPSGRKCLTLDERNQYYLPQLDSSQWAERACLK